MKKLLLVIFIVLVSSYFVGRLYEVEDKNHIALKSSTNGLMPGTKPSTNATELLKTYTKSAEQGDAGAQNKLGVMYENGSGVAQDYEQAFHWYTKAAEQGSADAQYNLGRLYDFFSSDRDTEKEDWVKKFFEYKDKAIYWHTKAAEQGHLKAQKELAFIHSALLGGHGPQEAVYWLKKVAERNDALAQDKLAGYYYRGLGTVQNFKKAFTWYLKAAEQGVTNSQHRLGQMYQKGEGVEKNLIMAYVWESLAAAKGNSEAIKKRDFLSKKLSSQQLTEAQTIATNLQYQFENKSHFQEKTIPETTTREVIRSGTGFFISKDGHILTCLHVVQDATRIEIYVGDKMYPAFQVRSDPKNDLAILKINGSFPALAFSPHRSAKMGQDIFTVGYPNPGLQGVNAKYTKGTISSLTGYQDDRRLYQISIPIQPGNSGGALLDENGNILGVVIAMLNAKKTFEISGSLPQNVNYAVKSLYAQSMIDAMPEVAGGLISPSKSKSNSIQNAQESTVMVVCYD